jgi:hypothetical protein
MQRFRRFAALSTAGLLAVALSWTEDGSAAEPHGSASIEQDCCAVLELRQYTMKPGQRDAMIALFDRHFIESQEAVGMTIVGQFRDRHRPDRFVWIRGFADMRSRHAALERFYGGRVWAEHKAEANSTMIDVSDVRLLKPARLDTAFRLDLTKRPSVGESRPGAIVIAGIHRLRQAADASIVSQFEDRVKPMLRHEGVRVNAAFVTEPAANTFKRLPVREGEYVLVWFGTLERDESPSIQRLEAASAVLGAEGLPEFLELEPTSRSMLGR